MQPTFTFDSVTADAGNVSTTICSIQTLLPHLFLQTLSPKFRVPPRYTQEARNQAHLELSAEVQRAQVISVTHTLALYSINAKRSMTSGFAIGAMFYIECGCKHSLTRVHTEKVRWGGGGVLPDHLAVYFALSYVNLQFLFLRTMDNYLEQTQKS